MRPRKKEDKRLLPCPFCGEKQPKERREHERTFFIESNRYAVLCAICEARGPAVCFDEDEFKAWNTRAK